MSTAVWFEKNRRNKVEYMRETVILQCTECKRRNYMASRDKRKRPERLELKKYCKFDRKHTVHKETR